jgi:hypothetical protein
VHAAAAAGKLKYIYVSTGAYICSNERTCALSQALESNKLFSHFALSSKEITQRNVNGKILQCLSMPLVRPISPELFRFGLLEGVCPGGYL